MSDNKIILSKTLTFTLLFTDCPMILKWAKLEEIVVNYICILKKCFTWVYHIYWKYKSQN